MTRVVLLAGPSGSGKSRVAQLLGATSLRLDDFYHDVDRPGLPRTGGIVDWDDPATWDADAAAGALRELVETGRATVPSYSIPLSRRTGEHEVRVGSTGLVIAEGIFAIELLQRCRETGLAVEAYYLDRHRTLVALLRLRRDLKEHRKPPHVLVRRGFELWRMQPRLRARALAAGFKPVTMRQVLALCRAASRAPNTANPGNATTR